MSNFENFRRKNNRNLKNGRLSAKFEKGGLYRIREWSLSMTGVGVEDFFSIQEKNFKHQGQMCGRFQTPMLIMAINFILQLRYPRASCHDINCILLYLMIFFKSRVPLKPPSQKSLPHAPECPLATNSGKHACPKNL